MTDKEKQNRTDSAFLGLTPPQRRCRETFRSGTPRNKWSIEKQKLRVLAGPDLHRAPSQYSIKCNDKNENQSELEAEHQSKAGGVRKRRSAPSSDTRRQRACMCRSGWRTLNWDEVNSFSHKHSSVPIKHIMSPVHLWNVPNWGFWRGGFRYQCD